MSQEITLMQTFAMEFCCNCGVAFAIPLDMQRRLIVSRKSFYCPNGHRNFQNLQRHMKTKHAQFSTIAAGGTKALLAGKAQ